MKPSIKEKPAETERGKYEELPLSFEVLEPSFTQEDEESSKKTPVKKKKKTLAERFSFPKGIGELLGGYLAFLLGANLKSAIAYAGLLGMLKGIITLLGAFAILIYKTIKKLIKKSSGKKRKCLNCGKPINSNEKYCHNCGAKQ